MGENCGLAVSTRRAVSVTIFAENATEEKARQMCRWLVIVCGSTICMLKSNWAKSNCLSLNCHLSNKRHSKHSSQPSTLVAQIARQIDTILPAKVEMQLKASDWVVTGSWFSTTSKSACQAKEHWFFTNEVWLL